MKKQLLMPGWWHRSLLLLALLLGALGTRAQTFTHPSIPFTNDDLNQLRANITQQPWLAGYQALQNDPRSQLSYNMQGPFATVSRVPNVNNPQWISDMIAIHNLTFMYVFTNNTAYAQKATNMLDAWATTNTTWGGAENQLDIGDYTPYFVTAADILRGTYPGWTAANTQHVKDYFRNVLLPPASLDYTLRDNNKGALQLQTGLAIAAFLDDRALFEKALEIYRIDAGGGLRTSLPNGEVGDTGRDDHWFTEIQALGWSAEVAWKQGYDVFGDLNNRLLAIGELYNQYSIAPSTVGSFIPFGGYAAYWTNWGIPPGVRHQSPFNNIIENAYNRRKGLATPYTTQMRGLVGEGAWSFLYLKSADNTTATALPPIAFPATPPAAVLSNVEIGSTGINGSASYANGTWTARGAGTSPANSLNFTCRPVSGDAGIVVKVESSSSQPAEVGLMIRESLTTTSNYVAARLLGNNAGMGSVALGQTANTVYTHAQPNEPWWLKLERVGNRVFTYHSADGVNWTNNALFIMTLPADTYIGFYTVSNNLSQLNTAVLSQVGITNTTPAGAPSITSSLSAAAMLSTAFSYATTATNSPTAFSASGLPAGLSINTSTGVISGTPTAAGNYAVRVTATNASGTGAAVVAITVSNRTAPAAPVATAAVSNVVAIRISWPAVANASSYTVKRAAAAAGPFTTLQAGITATSFTDTNPVPEATNYYVVTALAGTLESANSNVVSASVPPAIPSKPVITTRATQLDLTWGAVTGAVSYNVKRSTVPGGPYTTIGSPTTNSYSDLSVTPGTGYYYVVSAVGNTQQSANSPEAFGVAGSTVLTWSPNPVSTNFNLATDWVENMIPASPAVLNFGTSTDSVLTNDLSNLAVARLEFTGAARAYSIGGNSLELRNDIVSTSGRRQTLSMPLTLSGAVTVDATGPASFTGLITGSGSLTKKSNGLLYISGQNTYAGLTIISGPNNTSWPPVSGIEVAGIGTGTYSAPTSGPLGTGRIIFDGGSLSSPATATLYNDLEVPAGKIGVIMETTGALNLYGKFIGSGTIQHDGNTTAGLHLYADNSGFTGTFVSRLRSGNQRVRFEVPESGSAQAAWLLDANGNDCHGIQFRTGTLHFGSLSGRGYIRNNGGGTPTISIGALNTNTTYSGTMQFYFNVNKVGTGTLIFTGLHNYGGNTTIKGGKFLLNNDPVNGTFISPVIAQAGAFGGTGRSTAPVTIGTGAGAGATLEPGNQAVGTFLTTGQLTLLADATYAAELSLSTATSDKMTVGSVVLNNPALTLTAVTTGTLSAGTNFTLIDNTGSAAVTGTFNNLPELAAVTVGGYTFRITYRGGTGNDVVLLDERTLPATITSPATASGTVGTSFSYTITATGTPTSFSATGLPAGLSVNTSTGVISGTPTAAGTFSVSLSATNANGTGTQTLTLMINSNAALSNMVVSSPQNLQGAYNNVTITGPATGGAGVATLTGALMVSGTLTVQDGAVLITNCQPVTGGGSFELQAGGELRVCDVNGLASTGGTGAIQVSGTRTFSPGASYVYNGTAPQITGAGLPSQVRNLTINNASGVVLSGKLSISQVLSLPAGNLTAGNNLTLLSDASGTAMVVNGSATAGVSGDVTVQRYIDPSQNAGAGYRHYSSPVQSTSMADLTTSGFTPIVNSAYNTQGNTATPFPTVFGFDQSRLTATAPGFDQGWYSPTALTDLLAPGLGYTVNIPASQTVDFVGTLTNGNISRPGLAYGSQTDAGWQLLGNPYPSPLDWDQVGRVNVGSAVYVYHSSGQYAGTYSSYVAGAGGVGTNGGTNQLALGQGFFVRTSAAGATGTVNFTNAARLTTYTSPVFNRTAANSNPLVRLALQPATGAADETVVYFPSGATGSFDADFDAYKLPVGGTVLLASELTSAEPLSINALPVPGATQVVVPLRVQVGQAGTYTLRATELLNMPAGLRVYLRDAQTGTSTDLTTQPSYVATLTPGAATGRFALVFGTQAPLATAPAALTQQVALFPNPAHQAVSLSLPAALSQQAIELTLLNVLGQAVQQRTLPAAAGNVRELSLTGLSQGVYTVRLQTPAGTIIKRLTIE